MWESHCCKDGTYARCSSFCTVCSCARRNGAVSTQVTLAAVLRFCSFSHRRAFAMESGKLLLKLTTLAFSWPLLLFMIRLSPDLLLMFSDYFCGCCLAIFRVADKRACVWIIVAMLSYTDGVWMLLFRSTSCDHSHCFRPHCFCFLIPVAFSCTLSLMQLFCLVM